MPVGRYGKFIFVVCQKRKGFYIKDVKKIES